MTTLGIVLICLAGAGMAGMVIHQVLKDRLYVGYAAAWLIIIFGVVCLVAIPPLAGLVLRIAEGLFSSSALLVMSLVFLTLVLIYFSIQLSILSDRVTKIAQALAISQMENAHATPILPKDSEDR
ncbi:MAG: DUF2304 domain-containing protein [Candidatus Lindowbacteria bacterium]|nr:DUF2304 domain-containing protein [Candidatus Lindowbacteria bacterium]